jgi:predicted RNA-binding protein
MANWLVSTTDESWKISKAYHVHSFPRLADREKIKPGDKIIVYIVRSEPPVIVSVDEITDPWQEMKEPFWPEEKAVGMVMWPWHFPCRTLRQGAIDVRELVKHLNFIKNKQNWPIFFQGSPANQQRPIPDNDYELIFDELGKPPIQYSIRPSAEKYQAFWPLPGGRETYTRTLQSVLAFIKENGPSEEEIKDWFFKKFPKVTRGGSTRGYIRNTLWHSGLVYHDKRRHFLTESGEKYLAKPDSSLLFRILDEHVIGFRETLDIISQTELDMEELGKELSTRLQVSWESAYAQPQWRVNWLISMGFVTFEGARFKLTQEGVRLHDSLALIPVVERTAQTRISREAEEKGVALPTVVDMDYIPPVLARIDKLSELELEQRIWIAGRMLGFEVDELGQGKGPVPDAVYRAETERRYAILVDAKLRSEGYDMGTDYRTIMDYLDRKGKPLRKKAYKLYYAIISRRFRGDPEDGINRVRKQGVASNVTLLTTEALLRLVELKLKDPLLGLDEIQNVFDEGGIITAVDIDDLVKR